VTLLLAESAYAYDLIHEDEAWPCKHIAVMRARALGLTSTETDKDGKTISRITTIVQKPIDAGANVHQGNDIALHKAMTTDPHWLEGSKTLVRLLLDNGANVNAQDDQPRSKFDSVVCRPSTLYGAVNTGSLEFVKLVHDHGANLNGYGWTRHSPKELQLQLERDAECSYKCYPRYCLDRYDTVLLGAIRRDQVHIARFLLAKGADIKTLDTNEACNLIAAAAERWFGYKVQTKGPGWVPETMAIIVDRMLEIRSK
jgi:ankyrin repeat protein